MGRALSAFAAFRTGDTIFYCTFPFLAAVMKRRAERSQTIVMALTLGNNNNNNNNNNHNSSSSTLLLWNGFVQRQHHGNSPTNQVQKKETQTSRTIVCEGCDFINAAESYFNTVSIVCAVLTIPTHLYCCVVALIINDV